LAVRGHPRIADVHGTNLTANYDTVKPLILLRLLCVSELRAWPFKNMDQVKRGGNKLVVFRLEYENAMLFEIYRCRWMQELGELDRLMDKNLEQVLEQRYLSRESGRWQRSRSHREVPAGSSVNAPNLFCRSREFACGITSLNLLRLRKPGLPTKISATNDLGSGLPEAALFAAVCRHL
jgi:hypothetical protein